MIGEPESKRKVGSRLAVLRNEAKLSQQGLSELLMRRGLQYTPTAISGWERGISYPPVNDPEFAEALAASLQINTKSLLSLLGYFDPNGSTLSPIEAEVLQAFRERNHKKIVEALAALYD